MILNKPYMDIGQRAPMVHTCKRVGSLVRHSFLRLYSLKATIEGKELKVLLADDGSTFDYIHSILKRQGPVIAGFIGRVTALKGPELASEDADIVITGANHLLAEQYRQRGFRIVPKWVQLRLPVTEEPYQRLYDFGRQSRKYFKWMIKKTRDMGFECEICKNPEWISRFYNDMYIPYAQQRFGENAIVHRIKTIERTFLGGGIAVAKKDGMPVAATVFCQTGDILKMPHAGVTGGNEDVVQDGAAFALDFFLAEYAYKEGLRYVDFGHSRPFLSDGTLKYKLNWHMDVLPDDDGIGVFAIGEPRTSVAENLLKLNPHFYLAPDGGCRLSDE